MAQEIPLDGDLIKVLASDTRREILRILRERRHTVTELADELDLQKATVHEHLRKLVDADLISRQEDDRLWVYYQLSPRGKRILNPERSRIYLVVGLGVLAAIVAAAALAFFLAQTPSPGPAAQDGLDVTLAEDRVVGEDGVRLTGSVNRTGDDGELRAYLVAPEDVDRLQRGDAEAPGIPLSAQTDLSPRMLTGDAGVEGDAQDAQESPARTVSGPLETTFTTDARVPAGSYYLYVRSGTGQDNLNTLTRVHVSQVVADVSHATWWQGVSGPLNLSVERDGVPAEGTVSMVPTGSEGTHRQRELVDGRASFPAEELDAAPAGTYAIRYGSTTGPDRASLGEVRLVEPSIAVTPRRSLAGTPTSLTVTVLGGQSGLDAPVVVEDEPIRGSTGDDGELRLELGPREPGTASVRVGRLAERSVTFVPGLAVSVTVEDGPRWHFELSHPNGTPAAHTAVRIDGRGVGFTNATGDLVLDELPQGRHRLGFQTPDGSSVERTVDVDGWTVGPVDPTAALRAEPAGRQGEHVAVDVHVDVAGPDRVAGTLTSHLADRPVDATEVDLASGNRTLRVSVPAQAAGQARFSAELDRVSATPLGFTNATTPPPPEDGTGDGGGAGDGDAAESTEDTSTSETGEDEASIVLDLATGVQLADDALTDTDGDGVATGQDNCPDTANPGQLDSDNDGTGDACDATDDRPDADGDGIVGANDDCPREAGPAANDGCPAGVPDTADGIAESQETPWPGALVLVGLVVAVGLASRRRA